MEVDLNQKEEYKETELGLLPKEWEVVKLTDLVNLQRGSEVGSDNYNKEGKGIRFLRVVDISGSRNELIYTTSKNIKKCDKNDVLITFDGSPGIVRRGLSGAYSSGIRKVIIKDNRILLDYVYYIALTHFVQQIIEKYSTGVTIKHASKSIPHIKIPLPPLSEQKKIAFALSIIQEAKEKTEDVIKAAKELKKSMMKHLFTYGPVPIDEAENVPLKETEIGLVPEKWEVVRLGDVFEIKQGKQLSSKESVENKIKKPFLRTSNITWGKIDISHIDFMYFTNEEFEKLKLKIGDILVCEGGDIGRTALYRGELKEAAYQNHLHRLRPREEGISEEFFVFWMNHAINQRQIYLYTANRTTIPNLSSSRLKNFKIPLPPLPVQQKIASILSAIDQKIEAEENKKKALEDLFKSMLHNLMTAKVRVKNLNLEVKNE